MDAKYYKTKYCKGMMHTIKSGDTLFSISRRYHVPLNVLLQANPYVDVYQLQIGDTICVPVRKREPETMVPPSKPFVPNIILDDNANNGNDENNGSTSGTMIKDNMMTGPVGQAVPVVDFEEEVPETKDGVMNEGAEDVVIKISEPGGTMKDLLSETNETPEGFMQKNPLDKIYLLPGIAYHLKK